VSSLPATLIPMEAIGRTADRLQMNPVFGGSAARAAGNNDMIAGVKRVFRQTIPHQTPAAAPFRGPGVHLSLPIGNLQGHERMRIAKIKIHQFAFDREALVFRVGGGELIVSVRGPANRKGPGDNQTDCRSPHSPVISLVRSDKEHSLPPARCSSAPYRTARVNKRQRYSRDQRTVRFTNSLVDNRQGIGEISLKPFPLFPCFGDVHSSRRADCFQRGVRRPSGRH